MLKISLDNINLSKIRPVFMGGTDRTCEVLNYYLDMRTVKVPFYGNFFTLRINIDQNSVEKIDWILNEIN